MSTRSFIVLANDDKSYDSIYCHWDGYPEFTGNYLYKNYKTYNDVRKLIDMGDRSSIDKDDSVYKESKGLFGHYVTLDDLIMAYENSWCEYLYIFIGDKWCLWEDENFIPLQDVLEELGVIPTEEEKPIVENNEDDDNYRPTPEALLFSTLDDWGFHVDWNYKIFHGVYEDFMNDMVKHGYAVHQKNEKGDK